MPNYKIPEGTLDAARGLLAEMQTVKSVTQVHEICLRSEDFNEDPETPIVHFVPIGNVIGIAIAPPDVIPKDSDFVFVSAHAFGNMIPALGFTISAKPVEIGFLNDPK